MGLRGMRGAKADGEVRGRVGILTATSVTVDAVAALFCAGEGGCDRRTFTDPGLHRVALTYAGVWAGMFALASWSVVSTVPN